jgi:hypothetical protein
MQQKVWQKLVFIAGSCLPFIPRPLTTLFSLPEQCEQKLALERDIGMSNGEGNKDDIKILDLMRSMLAETDTTANQ